MLLVWHSFEPTSRKVPSVTVSVESAAAVATTSVIPPGYITSAVACVAVPMPKCSGSLPCRAYSPPPPLFWRKLIPARRSHGNTRADPAAVRLHARQVHLDEMVRVPVVLKKPVESECSRPGLLCGVNPVFQDEVEKSIVLMKSPQIGLSYDFFASAIKPTSDDASAELLGECYC